MYDEEPDLSDGRRNRRLKTQQQHADLVDEIERGLSRALQDYRYHTEEVLAKFLVDLEKSEAAHELEVAKLRAENCKLRDALGLKDAAGGPELFQAVLFAQSEVNARAQRKNTLSKVRSGAEDEPGSFLGPRSQPRCPELSIDRLQCRGRNSVNNQTEQHGGAWQYFVAWVPNGAALRSPEPWKPLSQDTQPQPPKGLPHPALPGMVPEDSAHSSKKPKKVRDLDDSSDSEDEDDREPYEVCEAWKVSERQLDRLKKAASASDTGSRFSGSHGSSKGSDSVEDDDEQIFEVPDDKPCFIVHPSSYPRVMWDLGSLLMVVYDMIMIPMSAFNLPDTTFLVFMDWVTRLFWTSDMGWSVFTGVVLPDGKITFEFKYILKRYMKTWFALDCLIVSSDWMEVILSSTNIIGLGRLARAFRIARVVRLLRLVRMQEVMQSVTERVQSDKLLFILGCVKLVVFVAAMSHVLACCWWAVGDSGMSGASWPSAAGVLNAEPDMQYLVALHWSVSQFTGGMDEVMPMNNFERFYAVVAWFLGFMGAAIICAIMTSNLTHLHIIGGAQARQMATLRKYLKQNHIPKNLALRVQRSAQHAVTGDLAAESVELLAVVAEPLKVELNFEMYATILKNHPLFSDWIYEDPHVIRRVSYMAITTSLMASHDVIFSKGEVPRDPKMYFVVKGLCEYQCRGSSVTVGERQWASEAALWTSVWTHKGTLTASTEVKMVNVDAKVFREIVYRFKGKKNFDPRVYANGFVEHLNKTAKVDDLTFIS